MKAFFSNNASFLTRSGAIKMDVFKGFLKSFTTGQPKATRPEDVEVLIDLSSEDARPMWVVNTHFSHRSETPRIVGWKMAQLEMLEKDCKGAGPHESFDAPLMPHSLDGCLEMCGGYKLLKKIHVNITHQKTRNSKKRDAGCPCCIFGENFPSKVV